MIQAHYTSNKSQGYTCGHCKQGDTWWRKHSKYCIADLFSSNWDHEVPTTSAWDKAAIDATLSMPDYHLWLTDTMLPCCCNKACVICPPHICCAWCGIERNGKGCFWRNHDRQHQAQLALRKASTKLQKHQDGMLLRQNALDAWQIHTRMSLKCGQITINECTRHNWNSKSWNLAPKEVGCRVETSRKTPKGW